MNDDHLILPNFDIKPSGSLRNDLTQHCFDEIQAKLFRDFWDNMAQEVDMYKIFLTTPYISDCKHDKVPFVKSHYGEEMVQRGCCPDCGVVLLELD